METGIDNNKLDKAKILVIGDILLDVYWDCSSTRISPEAPLPVFNVNKIFNHLGGAANVAKNLKTLNCNVMLYGAIGKDNNGRIIKKLLSESKISNLLKFSKDFQTITKIRTESNGIQTGRYDFEEKINFYNFKNDIFKNLKTKEIDYLVLSDYAKGTLKDIEKIIEYANSKNIPTIVDPKGNNFYKYRNCTLLKPNQIEFEKIVGKTYSDRDFNTKALKLKKELNIDCLMITMGEKGIVVVSNNGIKSVNSEKVEVSNIIGAGDTTLAAITKAFSNKLNYYDSAKFAVEVASKVVTKKRTASVYLKEISKNQNKFLPNKHIKKTINYLKEKGHKIVFTNGCFDIVHLGHIKLLKESKKYGDILIVAINSDKSVKQNKGKDRPLNNENDRIKFLSELNYVDFIIIFDEKTPLRLIKEINPDYLVKGSDYKLNEIVGYDYMMKIKGKVITIEVKNGYSSSKYIKEIKS